MVFYELRPGLVPDREVLEISKLIVVFVLKFGIIEVGADKMELLNAGCFPLFGSKLIMLSPDYWGARQYIMGSLPSSVHGGTDVRR